MENGWRRTEKGCKERGEIGSSLRLRKGGEKQCKETTLVVVAKLPGCLRLPLHVHPFNIHVHPKFHSCTPPEKVLTDTGIQVQIT